MTEPSPTILLVDDEDSVRKVLAFPLEKDGYTVIQAPSGRAALDLLAAGETVDAVLTDVVMPDMGGGELAERLRELAPALPVLYMSGYTGTDVLRRGFDERGVPFLQKPFSPASLTAGIRYTWDKKEFRATNFFANGAQGLPQTFTGVNQVCNEINGVGADATDPSVLRENV